MDKNNKNNSNAFSFNEGTQTKNLKSKVQNNYGGKPQWSRSKLIFQQDKNIQTYAHISGVYEEQRTSKFSQKNIKEENAKSQRFENYFNSTSY